MLKKAGLKVSGKKATLRARAKKAHLVRGGTSAVSTSQGAAEQSQTLTGGGWAGEGNQSFASFAGPGLVGQPYMLSTGGRRHSLKTKSLKKLLKKAGLKTSGKKSTLTKRAKSAHLIRGGSPSAGTNEQYAPAQ
jgi:hypothetical protein